MHVENTEFLLKELSELCIDFAFIEGHFDRSLYDVQLFKQTPFIAVCSPESHLCGQKLTLEDLMSQRLIIREGGSGTRKIFEQILFEHNLTFNHFSQITEIGSLNVIKYLVRAGDGITFIYEDAVKEELKSGSLVKLDIAELPVFRDFSFVTLKNSKYAKRHMAFLSFCKENISEE